MHFPLQSQSRYICFKPKCSSYKYSFSGENELLRLPKDSKSMRTRTHPLKFGRRTTQQFWEGVEAILRKQAILVRSTILRSPAILGRSAFWGRPAILGRPAIFEKVSDLEKARYLSSTVNYRPP